MLYYPLYGILYALSRLPLPVLYVLSDGLALILYHLIRYRRTIVRKNLQNSFPEKSLHELITIEKNFYRFFTQWIIETLKLLSISENELKARCQFTEEFQKIFTLHYQEKHNIIALMGHLGNWEWAGAAFNLYFPHKLSVLYHPLSNKTFDKLMKKIRTCMGTRVLPMHTATRHILANQQSGQVFTFIADQCPSLQNSFWTHFLNQETAVFYGPEKIIHKTQSVPVVVLVLPHPHKRGYYYVDAKEIVLTEKDTQELYPMMQVFMKILEEAIKQFPAYWLWSHKRWKFKKQEN